MGAPVTGGGTLALLSARIEAQQSEEVVQRLGASREFLPVTRAVKPWRGDGHGESWVE